jgi:outer membrane protein assembly factor BamA
MREDGITAQVQLISGSRVCFDSLQIIPSDLVKSTFLSSFLGIKEGEPFNELFFKRINNRIKRLPYLQLQRAPSVVFFDNKAYPLLSLETQKVNQVDGVLGLLPNELDPGKVLVTGQLNLDLHNLFQSGKRLGIEWQKMRPESQLLRMEYGHPNLLNSPINLDLGFYLLKEDSSFLNTDLHISLGYLAGNASQLKFMAGNQRGSLLSVGQGSEQSQFSNLADTQYSYYGVSWNMITTDDPFHPFRGWNVNVSANIGNRRILENASLPPAFYEGLDLRSVKFTIQGSAEYFNPLSSRIILRSKIEGGLIENQRLFLNELYRLGGLNSLRGFNENFFFASHYAMINLEPRFYLDPNSYFFLFYDQAYLNYELETTKFEDSPFGIGAGLSFTTNAGIFNLAYGLGNSKLQKFEFSNSKIHIGYISRF